MRHLVIVLAFLGTLAYACPNGSCGNGPNANTAVSQKSVLGTLYYALNIMQLQDDAQIQLALQSYHMQVRSLPGGMDTDAFKNGSFNRETFLQKSMLLQKANAQADLFEKIYQRLDSEQKHQLHRLMAAHQYYVGGFEKTPCGQQKNCNCPSQSSCGCDGTQKRGCATQRMNNAPCQANPQQ